MAKLTKAGAKRRLEEARSKVFAVCVAGHLTIDQANKVLKPLEGIINRMK